MSTIVFLLLTSIFVTSGSRSFVILVTVAADFVTVDIESIIAA